MRFGGFIFKNGIRRRSGRRPRSRPGIRRFTSRSDHTADQKVIDGYKNAAEAADLVICEIGVGTTCSKHNAAKREAAISRAIHQLELADYVGANCCVNIAGSYSDQWDSPHKDNPDRKRSTRLF